MISPSPISARRPARSGLPARRLTKPATLAVLALLVPALARAQQPFTLEEVMSGSFPTDLVAAPTGARVAWVENREGLRNVWVADGPDFEARALTSYADDDGQEITDLRFTTDGERILYVRGGAPNRDGYVPNPTSDPAGAERAIWVVDVAGGAPRRLAAGSAPRPSPRGDVVAYGRGGQIWTVPLDGGEPRQLLGVRRGATSPRWSPDGSRFAFVTPRGDHAFVGVFTPADSTLVWMAPGIDRDGDPVWSPDGSRIAFLRVPNRHRQLPFEPMRASNPFSILVGDPDSGEATEIWRAEPGPGSAFQGVEADGQLHWAAGDRLVFPWERTGWLHLWSVPAQGGEAAELTPGAFEVQHASMTPDGAAMLVSSNQDDIDRRHVWRAPVDGGGAELLTPGEGLEWRPVMTADGSAVAYLASTATRPARVEVSTLADGARRALARPAVPASFPEALVLPEPVTFQATDGMAIRGQLFLPAGRSPGERHPAVVFLHGGSRRQMMLGFHDRGYYHNAYAFNQYLASRGYVVLAINYRSGIGYGLEFREALDYGATGGSEFRDVMGAGLYLAGRADVDSDRIGLWGGSYGGYLTAMGLSRASDLFRAGVDFHGVHDWNEGIYNFRRDYDRGQHPEFARTAWQASPMSTLDTWRSPVLLIHGDDDRNVAFSETVTLAEELRERGVHVESLVFPDEVHGFLLHRSWLRAYRATADFLDRFLR